MRLGSILKMRMSILNTATTEQILGERNFTNYPNLKTVTIKGVLSEISNSAFEGCKQIKSITATGAVNATGKKALYLGECAFKDCTGLESVEFTGSLVVSKNAFEGCTNLGSVKVKESDMALLENYAFLNCTKLTEADIPGKLLIQEGAFFECTSLKKFDFSNVSSIGKIAFYHCSSLESIVLPENVTVIGNSAFQGCNGVTSLNIPGTVKSIGEEAFCSCEKLKELVVNEGVSSIGKQAFAGCKSLETITLPKSAAIGEKIFTDYKPIKTIRYTGTREDWVAAGLNQNNFYNATVYQWGNGRSIPDVGIIDSLCKELNISIGEFFAGEKIQEKEYKKETEKMLLASLDEKQLYGVQTIIYILEFVSLELFMLPFQLSEKWPSINRINIIY